MQNIIIQIRLITTAKAQALKRIWFDKICEEKCASWEWCMPLSLSSVSAIYSPGTLWELPLFLLLFTFAIVILAYYFFCASKTEQLNQDKQGQEIDLSWI